MNKQTLIRKYLCLILYYGFARHLPVSYSRIGGGIQGASEFFYANRYFCMQEKTSI